MLASAFALDLQAQTDCEGGSIATVTGDTIVYTCPGDTLPDIVVFSNTADTAANFIYVVTDTNTVILDVSTSDSIDFEGAGEGICWVWGLSYTDTLRATVGDTASTTVLSDSCADLSDNYITVIRAVPDGGVVSTVDGATDATVCLTDTVSDVLEFAVNGNSAAQFTYVVTDTANVILEVPSGKRVDFSTAGVGISRVWGLSYTGTITAALGDTASQVSLTDDCFSLSTNFVTVSRDTACEDTTTTPPPAGGPSAFTLVDADTDMDLQPIADGDSIDVSQYAIAYIDHLNLRYEPDTGFSPIGSVVFDFNGETAFNIEQIVPYALGGDDDGNYHPVGNSMTLGTHTVVATLYSSYQGTGTQGPSDTLTFTLYDSGGTPPAGTDSGEVVGFTLINADADEAIRPLMDGDTIDLSALASPNISIQADTDPTEVGSVVFDFDGASRFRVENVFPYSLGGDIRPDFWAVEMPDGTYTLTATPYESFEGSGAMGTPLTITFTVISSPFRRMAVAANHHQLFGFPNPAESQVTLEMPEGRRGTVDIQVVNTMGDLMLRDTFSTGTDNWRRVLDTSDFPPGLYIVHIQNAMFKRTMRLVKR